MKIFGPGMWQGINQGMMTRGAAQQQDVVNQRAEKELAMQQQSAAIQQAQAQRQKALYDQQMKERDAARAFMVQAMSQGVNPTIQGLMSYNQNPGPRVGVNPAYQQMQGLSPEFMAKVYTGGLQTPQEAAQAGINTYRTKKMIDQQTASPDRSPFERMYLREHGKLPGSSDYSKFKQSQRPKTTVTTNVQADRKETKFNETLGTEAAKSYVAYLAQGKAASRDMEKYKVLGRYLKDAGSGILRGKTLKLQQLADAVGLPVDIKSLDAAQAVKVISNQMALALRSPAAGMGMPGQMSDKDREFLMESVPGLLNSPGAAQKIVDYYLKLTKRRKEVSKMAQDWYLAHGKSFDEAEFNQYLDKWTQEHPLFPKSGVTNDADAAAQALIDEVLGGK